MKYTTVALNDNQYLKAELSKYFSIETYCQGYTNGKRDKTLDGWYFTKELQLK